mgnify:CR=1 FL=1
MTDPITTSAQMRKERIERLLSELEYEIVRGVMEREIEPDLHLRKVFPCIGRGDGLAAIELHVYPAGKNEFSGQRREGPKMRVVEGCGND